MIINNPHFIQIDIILRRGGHINISDINWYEFITQNYEELSVFYSRYQCSLMQHPDGFFYLLSSGGLLPSRLLSKGAMHTGMFIALKMRDPEITQSSGKISTKVLLQSIETGVSRETLRQIHAPKKRVATQDDHIADGILRSLKVLEELRFISIKDEMIRPLEAINRFSDVARYENIPGEEDRDALRDRGIVLATPEVLIEEIMADGEEDEIESSDR